MTQEVRSFFYNALMIALYKKYPIFLMSQEKIEITKFHLLANLQIIKGLRESELLAVEEKMALFLLFNNRDQSCFIRQNCMQ